MWRFGVRCVILDIQGDSMKDIRISIRLTKEEHIKFKTIATKKQVSMQDMLKEYVLQEIKKEEAKKNEQTN